MKNLFNLILLLFLMWLCSLSVSYAQNVNGEISFGVKGIKFKDVDGVKPLATFEFGNRWNNLGVLMSLGGATVDSQSYYIYGMPYRDEINYYPLELNLKGFIPLRGIELGIGAGFSMNFLDFKTTNELNEKEIQSNTQLLFGVQGMAELKFLFPSSTGLDAFVGLEGAYQYVGKANTYLGDLDLSNYRLGIRLGGRF